MLLHRNSEQGPRDGEPAKAWAEQRENARLERHRRQLRSGFPRRDGRRHARLGRQGHVSDRRDGGNGPRTGLVQPLQERPHATDRAKPVRRAAPCAWAAGWSGHRYNRRHSRNGWRDCWTGSLSPAGILGASHPRSKCVVVGSRTQPIRSCSKRWSGCECSRARRYGYFDQPFEQPANVSIGCCRWSSGRSRYTKPQRGGWSRRRRTHRRHCPCRSDS